MASLTTLRENLATRISEITGDPAFAYLLERPIPPVALVSPSTPYVQADTGENTFGEFLVNLRVDIIGPTATNEARINGIDDTISEILASLADSEWLVETVSAPYGLQVNNAEYLSVTLTVSTFNRF